MVAFPPHHPKLPAGLSAHRAGRLAEAERLYREALEANPHDADALHLLGMLLGDPRREGDVEEAMKLLDSATEIDPSAPQVQLNLGCLLGRMGRHGEAVERFRSALRLRPDYPEAAENLATALDKLRRWRESAEVCRKIVALHPDFAPAHHLLGDALRRMGKPLHAAAAHRRVARLRPNRTEALAADYVPSRGVGGRSAADHRYRNPEYPVARLIEPILRNLDRTRFSSFCYSDVRSASSWLGGRRSQAGTDRQIARHCLIDRPNESALGPGMP